MKPTEQSDIDREMAAELIQITSRTGEARTASHIYQPPNLIELTLDPNQRVIQIDWSRGLDSRRRKTVDWTWTAWIETRL